MDKKNRLDKIYSEEISLTASDAFADYVLLNLRKIHEYRKQFHIPVIGIAGTEGKTSTKRMLEAILSPFGEILQTPLDCSTASAVTSTLLQLNEHHRFALLELGIVNQKQFQLAVQVAEPTIGIITNIGEAHMASLGNKYLIADAKVELIKRLPADGYAILNMDDDLVSGMEQFSPTNRIIKFGFNPGAHFYANNIEYLGPEGIRFKVNDYYTFHLPIYGSASVYNALAAIATARVLGIDYPTIQEGLQERFSPLDHRGNLLKKNDLFILDHSYDATINSVTKACESLVQFKKFSNQLILIIGDISNPGANSRETHLHFGHYISALPIDIVFTIGNQAKFIAAGIRQINHTSKKIVSIQNPAGLIEALSPLLKPRTTILIIGSKTLRLFEVVEDLLTLLN